MKRIKQFWKSLDSLDDRIFLPACGRQMNVCIMQKQQGKTESYDPTAERNAVIYHDYLNFQQKQ